ncbi:MAG: DNA polymerase III subunit delta [Dehalococcoidales bacterium]|nr:DNA polymerase III subunit delta [Dehalococcoidales bacterium]
MLYILWGDDQFSLEETLQGIKKSLGDLSVADTNIHNLDGQKLSVSNLRAVGEAMPFLSPKRLVIVQGLLSRFEPGKASSRSKGANTTGSKKDEASSKLKGGNSTGSKKDEAAVLAECIKGLPDTTIMVLTDRIESKKPFQDNPLYNALAAKAEIRSFPLLKGLGLSQWIQSRVNRMGGGISRQGVSLLMDFIGGDLFTMSNEINKLVAYAAGRQIEEKDIRAVVGSSREAEIFTLIDAVIDRKSGVAEQILQKLLQTGIAPQQILVLLARQLQMMVQVKELKGLKRPLSEIKGKIGIYNSFVWDRIAARTDKYSGERLREIYRYLLETDIALKTGRMDGDLAMNLLVADLCERSTR